MKRLFACLLALCALTAQADSGVVLIQQGPAGFVVWYPDGESHLGDDELLEIMATATPEGGAELATPHGPARAYELPAGILVGLPAAPRDDKLLVDRDACGHIIVWHVGGTPPLDDSQLTEVVMSALPEGGPRLQFGDRYVKGFIGKLGVTATLWKAVPKK